MSTRFRSILDRVFGAGLLGLILTAGTLAGESCSSNYAVVDIGDYFIVRYGDTPDQPLITVDRETRRISAFFEGGLVVFVDEFERTTARAKNPAMQKDLEAMIRAFIGAIVGCATDWRVKRWQDLLPPSPRLRIHKNVQDEVRK